MEKRGRGRPKGSGNKDDDPLLREAYRAFYRGEFRTLRAAATAFAERLPYGEESRKVVNRDRLYNKLRDRREELKAELEAEIGREEGTVRTLEDRAEKLASELAGKPYGYKAELLYQLFKIFIVNDEAASYVVRRLDEDGLEISLDFLTYLNRITDKVVEKERAAFEDGPIGRYLKRQADPEK